jgi:hypothetical protein
MQQKEPPSSAVSDSQLNTVYWQLSPAQYRGVIIECGMVTSEIRRAILHCNVNASLANKDLNQFVPCVSLRRSSTNLTCKFINRPSHCSRSCRGKQQSLTCFIGVAFVNQIK